MQTYTVIGVHEDNDLQTFVDTVEAQNPIQAAVVAHRRFPEVSVVAVIPGDHTATVDCPVFAGQYGCFNGMDGADEITAEERGDLE